MEHFTVKTMLFALVQDRFVPFESQFIQRPEDHRGGPGLFPGRVYVFDSDQPDTGIGPGLQIAADGRNQRTKVQRTCG